MSGNKTKTARTRHPIRARLGPSIT